VDLGSAVTVDAVAADGAFLGGAIAPGLPSLRAGLRSAAPALPGWAREAPVPFLPRSTRQAVNWGIQYGLAGAVDRLVRQVGEEAGPGAPVYLTGGDAGLIADLLVSEATVVPDLTLHGVRILYDRARRA
jgi:type III pantothenate kinase